MRLFFLCVLAGTLSGFFGQAQPYYFKHIQTDNGLSFNSVFACVQDRQGFMWFGTRDGLNRYDGYNFKVFRNDPDIPGSIGSNFIFDLHLSPAGVLWVGTQNGLYRYDPQTENFYVIKESLGHGVRSIQMQPNGDLWFVWGSVLARYNLAKSTFRTYPNKRYFQANAISIDNTGQVWVGTNNGMIEKYDQKTDDFMAYDIFAHSPQALSRRIETVCFTGEGTLLAGTANQGIKLFDIKKGSYKDLLITNSNGTDIYARAFIKSGENEFWCATESGIYIYHSKNGTFTHLTKNSEDPYALSDNAVFSLCKDKEGGIYAGTYFGGVNYYTRQYSNFEKYFHTNKPGTITGNIIREICQDKYRNIWVGTEDAGLNKFNPLTQTFTSFYPKGDKNSLSYTNIHGLLARGDKLWIGTYEHGLDVMDIPTGRVIKHYATGTGNGLGSNFIVTLYQTSGGTVLLGTSQGLFAYRDETDRFEQVKAIPGNILVYGLLEDHTGTIWVVSLGDGLYRYKPGSKTAGHFTGQPGKGNMPGSKMLTSVFEDSRNNLWLTAENGGLMRLSADRKHLKNYTLKNGMPGNFTFKVLEDKQGDLWVTTTKGLACLNPNTGKIKTYGKANGLLTDQFNYNSAFKDKQGKMYFGSVKGLIAFDPEKTVQAGSGMPVYITGLQVDNKELTLLQKKTALKKSISYLKKVQLNYDQNNISIDFAALSYIAPEMTAYRYKLNGLDKDWTYLKTNRKVYYTQLPPGSYTFSVVAGGANNTRKSRPANLQIVIRPPFWASPLAYGLYALCGLALAYFLLKAYSKHIKNQNRRKIEFLENEQKKEVYEAKIEFFTHIAHEIRTPLTLIKAPLEIVKKSDNLDEVKENALFMEKNADRLLNLTNQLLDFRKTEIKGYRLNFIKSDISALLGEIYTQFKPAAHVREIHYLLHLPDAPVQAFIDQEAFRKIVENLIGNAIKYTADSVSVTLRFGAEDKLVYVDVQSNGDPIPDEMKDRIFEPFFRLRDTAKQPGTGIGLALARSLAQLHNGDVELLKSTGKTQAFVLRLPEHQEIEFEFDDNIPEIGDDLLTGNGTVATAGKPVILVAEDNRDILKFIEMNLGTAYSVIGVTDGQAALKKLAETPVQLVITDVMMPLMDGYELCKQIKTNFEHSHIPVIMLTAKNTLQSKIEGLESGADAYIEKPFSPEFLQVQIANLMENRRKLKSFFARSPLTHMKTMAHSKADEQFLEKLNQAIIDNMANIDLDPEKLATMLFMSRPTLFRKIKAVSDLTPNELINLARLKKAAQLLAEGDYRIYEVSDTTGFSSPTVFARIFHKQFGISPSEYAANQKKQTTTTG